MVVEPHVRAGGDGRRRFARTCEEKTTHGVRVLGAAVAAGRRLLAGPRPAAVVGGGGPGGSVTLLTDPGNNAKLGFRDFRISKPWELIFPDLDFYKSR